ncbi:retinol-binding protein pinta-like [Periplaneta americana]|uniref:retinol-binding protein pinta-like n=1 Tax=Periplaneta americana TaxID=6978 RepID=UPI0037E82968
MAVRTLSPELEEVARRELNEEPERREEDLKHIREWLSKQPHLIARTDSQCLLNFLRGCKFSLERTKSKLDMYYTFRTALPEFFSRRDPMLPEIQEILKLGVCIPLPGTDDEGRRITLIRSGIYDASKVKVENVFKVSFMVTDVLMEEDDAIVVNGNIAIIDLAGVTLGHAAQMTPSVVKKLMTTSQDGYALRQRGINYIHTPTGFETIFNLFKSFMKEKLKKRVHVHGDSLESLQRQIPKRILPQEYGGDAGPVDKLVDEWKRKLEARRSWFLENEKYKSDEKKRPGGRPKTQEDLFGVDGSFRQLNVD